jgi:endonuclease III
MANRLRSAVAKLKSHDGAPDPPVSRDPFALILFESIAYLADDEKRRSAFASLKRHAGLSPRSILAAPERILVEACRIGGIYPELRARRLRDSAELAVSRFGGDLRGVLLLPQAQAKKALQVFPAIGEPGAEKILLFCGAYASLAPDSNALRVLNRFGYGVETKSYSATYRSTVKAVGDELGKDCKTLTQAHLLLRRHGQEICRRSRPECERCPISAGCAYFRDNKMM